jgi:hypothetical protein
VPWSSHPCLPFCWSHCKQQGLFAPRALPRFVATTDPSATLSSFHRLPGVSGYTVSFSPPISQRDEEGFSSCLAHPCHRAVAITPQSVSPLQSVCDDPCCLRLMLVGSASGASVSRPFLRLLSLRPDDSLTIRKMALSIGFQDSVSFLLAIQATGLWLLPW